MFTISISSPHIARGKGPPPQSSSSSRSQSISVKEKEEDVKNHDEKRKIEKWKTNGFKDVTEVVAQYVTNLYLK